VQAGNLRHVQGWRYPRRPGRVQRPLTGHAAARHPYLGRTRVWLQVLL